MDDVYDLVGIGFGPSNLAVAIAAQENEPALRTVFFDRKPSFSWHSGLLFGAAEMQVSFTKDLITQCNPRSRFSFLNYLFEKRRLDKFINLRTFYPSRNEFNGYYAWAAEQFDKDVSWGTEVLAVSAEPGPGDRVELLRVDVRDVHTGQVDHVLTRNLCIAPGGTPRLPEGVQAGPRVFHASQTLQNLEALEAASSSVPRHFNIVGAGQTAADVFMHLRRAYPEAAITTNIRGFALRPEDDTHFVNEFFLPETTDWFYTRDPDFRTGVLAEYGLAAHTGVSFDLLPTIYREYYEDQVGARDALRLHRFTELTAAEDRGDHAVADYRNVEDGTPLRVTSDAVILATGYRYPMPIPALAGVADRLLMEAPDRYRIGRDYAVAADQDFLPRIYLQGFAEATHGFSEVLLSLMPFRAAEIIRSVAVCPVAAGN
ncbi:L-ornithine N5-oxygenase [Catenulispora sp. GP43]|uniref:lysine N(6)-hydroxylase/L-ornithine N(5)-oxygenase family protein n=1 Tax=Catenulispora sp. GP43 TaxID=3156263 RepID=UPI003512F434